MSMRVVSSKQSRMDLLTLNQIRIDGGTDLIVVNTEARYGRETGENDQSGRDIV
jgi:hypothetical protein